MFIVRLYIPGDKAIKCEVGSDFAGCKSGGGERTGMVIS
jgi:hypothetical protein